MTREQINAVRRELHASVAQKLQMVSAHPELYKPGTAERLKKWFQELGHPC